MTLSSHNSSRLFDYFLICGLDFTSGLEPDNLARDVHCSPLERSYRGRVLEHYPHSDSSNPFDANAICMMCLPHGLQFRTQKNLVEPKFHTFVITRGDGSRYYGHSLIFFEEVKNLKISNAMQDLQAMHLTELSSSGKSTAHNSRSLPRHFKLTTHQPRSAQNYYDSTKDTLYVSKSIGLVSRLPYIVVSEAFLRRLQKYSMTKPILGQLSVESYVYNFLYEVPEPRPGRSVSVQLVNSGDMVIQRPITIEELPLLDFSLETLFSLISIEHVVLLYTCILLENQVLISSTDYQKLMLVAECMSSLLFPFSWQHVYVPILPASLQHFLDAPVPFIMGLPSQDAQVPIASEADLCYLNVDTGIIQIPEEMPNFPRRKEFCQRLEVLLDRFDVTRCSESQTIDLMSSSVVLPGGFPEPLRRKHSWSHDADQPRVPLSPLQYGSNTDIVYPAREEKAEDCTDPIKAYLKQLTFNNAVRETFLHSFVRIFSDYQQFVIMPKEESKEEWFKNRETMVNFDKATFLSDQPAQHLPFLSQFLETQMFASLIDAKILAQGSEIDNNIRVFDKRIKNMRRRNGVEDGNDPCEVVIRESQRLIEKRFSDVFEKVPPPKEVLVIPSEHFRLKKTPKTFPSLDAVALNKEPRRSRHGNSNGPMAPPRLRRGGGESADRSHSTKSSLAHSPARIAQANWNFVETLLKECKTKTNRMVVEKMGDEGVTLGKQLGNVEENTLIASFCDLLEKIWSHGMQQKQGKSALWSHLIRFKDDDGDIVPEGADTSFTVSPDLSSLAQDLDIPRSGEPSPCNTPDSRSLERRSSARYGEYPSLKPLPVSVAFDVRNIEAMTDIKSEIGYSRAWIRLSLEKKLLSNHLQALLADNTLLKAQYKRNAFLRCEEEREQFLFHLLSLNAVDYHCFTNTYLTAKLPYRVMIVPVKRTHVSSTTANAWIAVSGTLCETNQIPVPKGSADFVFNHKNLGLLTTLSIGHDNSGISPNWFVDAVIVRCEVTGHTFRFRCGKYLGRRLEDGSSERLLVAERVTTPKTEDGVPPPQSPVIPRRQTQRSLAELQHMIGDSVNSIVKYFCRAEQGRPQGSLTPLLCGEMGLVDSLQHAFLYGFKQSRFFGKNFYLWDFFLKVKEAQGRRGRDCGSLDRQNHNRLNNNELHDRNNENDRPLTLGRSDSLGGWRGTADGQIPRASRTTSSDRRPNHNFSLPRTRSGLRSRNRLDSHTDVMPRYCELVDKIENSGRAFGKDGKFQQFVCLALRERILHRVIRPLSESRPTMEMYEENSFFRDPLLTTFLVDILKCLSEFDFSLESSITSGID